MDGCYSTLEIRRLAVAAIARGLSVADAARAYCTDRRTIHRWVARERAEGEDGLMRRPGSGRPRLLSQLTESALRLLVVRPATQFGFETDLWTVGRVRQALRDRYHVDLSPDTVWRRLRDAGLTYQKPERPYFEADPKARAHWLRFEAPKIRRLVREKKAILYFQDESNVSLSAFLGKTWAVRGQTPRAGGTGQRGSVSAMSAINGQGRLVFALYEKRIASPEVIEFLGSMLRHHPKRHLAVVMDQAPPHVSKTTRAYIAAQRRLTVFHLPTYSPDWNPDEKICHITTEE